MLYVLAGCIGFVVAYLIIRRAESPFEKEMHASLFQGKRVTVAIDEKCYVFQFVDGQLVIKYGEIEIDDMASDGGDQSNMSH